MTFKLLSPKPVLLSAVLSNGISISTRGAMIAHKNMSIDALYCWEQGKRWLSEKEGAIVFAEHLV